MTNRSMAMLMLFFLWPVGAHASICGDQKNIKELLGKQHAESQKAIGLINEKVIIEIYTSAKGTWSILMTYSTGRSCIIAAGKSWQEIKQAPPGSDA